MVALSGLVVISKNALALDYVGEAVLVAVARTLKWLRDLPEYEFGEGLLRVGDTRTEDLSRLNVGHDANMSLCCQQRQRSLSPDGGRDPYNHHSLVLFGFPLR